MSSTFLVNRPKIGKVSFSLIFSRQFLLKHCENQSKTLKGMSDTRWAARHDAVESFKENYSTIIRVLNEMQLDEVFDGGTRLKAEGYLHRIETLETAILTELWFALLSRINATSLYLQTTNIDLSLAVRKLIGLMNVCEQQKYLFDQFESKAKLLLNNNDISFKTTRANSSELLAREYFKQSTFNVIIDTFTDEISHRFAKYEEINNYFGVLTKYPKMKNEDIRADCEKIRSRYPTDLSICFADEFCQFIETYECPSSIPNVNDMRQFIIRNTGLIASFPNVEIILRIFLSMMISNATGERSFSKLSIIKNERRSTMGQNRLVALSLLSIESDIANRLNVNDIIKKFAEEKARKANFD